MESIYLKRIQDSLDTLHEGKYTDKLPIFELGEDKVKVVIYNKGREYLGEELHEITYEQFNKYLKQGIKKGGVGTDWDVLGEGGKYQIEFPPNTVSVRLEGGYIYVKERIGGVGYPTIESINKEGNIDKVKSDYDSIYEIEVKYDKTKDETDSIKGDLELITVNKFEGLLYQSRLGGYKRIRYLENYLKRFITESDNITFKEYKEKGLGKYIRYMDIEYKHTTGFLDEVYRSNRDKNGINWGNI